MLNKTILLSSHKTCIRTATNLAKKPKKYKMQAWQVHSYGGLEELQSTTARIPYISGPNELLVRVKAASINHIDRLMMTGYGSAMLNFMRGYELEFPLTLGREFAGIVEDKGRASNFQLGQRVYGVVPFHKQGSHAQYVISEETQTLPLPNFLDYTQGASLLFSSLTAWSSLFLTGELALRDLDTVKVLVLGASGGVGSSAVQILKSQKATVIGTCAGNAVDLVKRLGADYVFDYTKTESVEGIRSQSPYNIILDCAKIGYKNVPATWTCHKYVTLDSPLGHNLTKYGLTGGLAVSASDLTAANLEALKQGRSVRWGFFLPLAPGLELIGKLVGNKQLKPLVHGTFKFDEIHQAYKSLADGHLRGKIIVEMP